MAASINVNGAEVSSEALAELKTGLSQLSESLLELYDLMTADMTQVGEYWRDPKYEEFQSGYSKQIKECERISQRYTEWCGKVLDPAIERVIAIERTDVGGDGGSISTNGGVGDNSGISAVSSNPRNRFENFNFGSKNTTKAEQISNGCGSESSKASQIGARIAKPIDALLTKTSVKKQDESCDQHDKDYFHGVDKKTADNNFQKRSPIMGTAVKSAKDTSRASYLEAQKDRLKSQRLQPTWEKENQQCLDSENYKVTPN